MGADFFADVIAAGAILGGFAATFLVFRIQREADYYRNPSQGKINQQQFTSSFALILLATVVTIAVGVVAPLLTLVHLKPRWITPPVVVGGLFAGLALMAGYFFDELVHYRIVLRYWRAEYTEWRREWPIMVISFLIAVALFVLVVALTS